MCYKTIQCRGEILGKGEKSKEDATHTAKEEEVGRVVVVVLHIFYYFSLALTLIIHISLSL